MPVLLSDSSSALAVARRRGPGKMKHVEIRMLALQQWRAEGRLRFAKVNTEVNPSDLLTKPMTREKLVRFSSMIGLHGGPYCVTRPGI